MNPFHYIDEAVIPAEAGIHVDPGQQSVGKTGWIATLYHASAEA